MAPLGAFLNCCPLYLPMADLPIDPEDYPGTPEYQENQEDLKNRRNRALFLQYEEDQARRYCRHA